MKNKLPPFWKNLIGKSVIFNSLVWEQGVNQKQGDILKVMSVQSNGRDGTVQVIFDGRNGFGYEITWAFSEDNAKDQPCFDVLEGATISDYRKILEEILIHGHFDASETDVHLRAQELLNRG